MIGQPLSEITQQRILTKTDEGKGSTTAFVLWINNALMQRRQVAYDGQRWFYQATTRSFFTPIGEGEVLPSTKTAMEKFLTKLAANRRIC